MRWSEASFGQSAMRRLISSADKGVAHAYGGEEVDTGDMRWTTAPGVVPAKGVQCIGADGRHLSELEAPEWPGAEGRPCPR